MTNQRVRNFITSPKSLEGERRDGKVSFVLLAENHGYRMKSYGPISLVKIGNKTLIEHQIDAIRSSFIDFELIICAGFETGKIYNFVKKQFGQSVKIRIVENQVYYHSNCCESTRLCLNNVMNSNIVLCGGGVLLTPDYLKALNLKTCSTLYQESRENDGFGIGVIENEDRLQNLSLAVSDKIWTELTYLTGENIIQSFYNVVSNPEYKNKFLFEALNQWSGRKQIKTIENQGSPIVKINTIKTLKEVNL